MTPYINSLGTEIVPIEWRMCEIKLALIIGLLAII